MRPFGPALRYPCSQVYTTLAATSAAALPARPRTAPATYAGGPKGRGRRGVRPDLHVGRQTAFAWAAAEQQTTAKAQEVEVGSTRLILRGRDIQSAMRGACGSIEPHGLKEPMPSRPGVPAD